MVNATPETGLSAAPAAREGVSLIVTQPEKLGTLLDKINGMVGESAGKGPAGDMAMTGGSATGQGAKQQGPSPRDEAIARIPSQAVVQVQLTQHIQKEVRDLRREARKITRMSNPGSAYKLTLIYARIRRLNALLSELFDASVDMLKRLFIRVFIDKQPIL